eukprot:12876852-Ditylum_brightwellii.AAC.1
MIAEKRSTTVIDGGGSPLNDAQQHHHMEVADFPRSHGSSTGCAGQTSNLIAAAATCYADKVKMILSSAIPVTSKAERNLAMSGRDYNCQIAFHLAVEKGYIGVIELLCAKGVNPNDKDRWGGCLLNDVKHHNFEGCAKVLEKYRAKLVKGANIDEFHQSSAISSIVEE